MKKIILVAALATVTACNQAEAPAEPEATEEAAVESVAVAADGLPSVGVYNVTSADGTTSTFEAKEDGTYVATDADGNVTETGKWRQESQNVWCETPDTEGASEVCYDERMEDGVYKSTNRATGETATITRPEA
ncbi:MAG: hypothetical protein EP350_04430 [Alphaproteobacteria bacterium]|nr:MAG: hypothetical protein EP350_04430 [Alphaproteobacteria bacterium]